MLQFDNSRNRAKLCPCGRNNKDGKFAPFKGFEDKGHCHSCGNTFLPDQHENDWSLTILKHRTKSHPSFIDSKVFAASRQKYCSNSFVEYLVSLFGSEATKAVIDK